MSPRDLNAGQVSAGSRRRLRFMEGGFRNAVYALFLALVLLPVPLSAQTNLPPDRSSRYLFIVDTSAAMRRRAPAVERVVENLLRSSMGAQFRSGDTVGVWTFDEQLSAGRLPLQLWSPDRAPLVASNILGFFKTLRYEKRASNFEVVAPTLNRVIQDSSRLTIILLSDGNEKITGTPFDQQIKGAFTENFKVQEKARMPFVTVLRSVRGQIRNATVNQAPWPVEFPEWPPEPKIVEAPKPKPVEPKPAPRPTLPPLIVIGKKPEVAVTNAAPIVSAATNVPAAPALTDPATTPVAPPAHAAAASPAPEPAVTPAAGETITPSPGLTNAAAAPVTAPVPPPSAPAAGTKANEPAPLPVASPPAAAPVKTPAGLVLPSANAAIVEAANTNARAPVALAVQPEPAFSRLGLIAIGVTLLLLAAAMFLLLQHRARRNAASASLITRSMDRDHK